LFSFIALALVRPAHAHTRGGRLTASKEAGETIEIDGKKVALGIPGARPPPPSSAGADPKTYPFIPLARPGTADEAAAAVLLCVPRLVLPSLNA